MARVTSEYGPRNLFGRSFHNGVDYKTPVGSPIYTNKQLTVTYAGEQKGYGKVVYAVDQQGNEYRFGHLDSIPEGTKNGAIIPVGGKVANTGNTGDSTGAHLHFEVRQGGKAVDPMRTVDPTTGQPYDANMSFSPTGHSDSTRGTLRNTEPKPDGTQAPGTKPPGTPPSSKPPTAGDQTPQTPPGGTPPSRDDGPTSTKPSAKESIDKGKLVFRRMINPLLKLGDQ
jgi:hypothetical protein